MFKAQVLPHSSEIKISWAGWSLAFLVTPHMIQLYSQLWELRLSMLVYNENVLCLFICEEGLSSSPLFYIKASPQIINKCLFSAFLFLSVPLM
jgi:hypothetical protein